MMRWKEWLRWSWFGEAVKFVSSELKVSRSSAKEVVVSYRDLWPEEFLERPFTLAVWICSFAERYKVSASWMQAAADSLDQRQDSAVRRCGHSRMGCLLGQAAKRGLPGKQAFEFALSMLENRQDRTVRDKPAA